MDQGIRSRPRYEPLRLDPAGRWHLVVTDQPELPEGAFAEPPVGAELWRVAADGFVSEAELLAALPGRLAVGRSGGRLYAVGSEAFIWDVAGCAAAMGPGEVFLRHAGSLRRRVYCVHCKAMTEAVTTTIAACVGCGAALFVRDHFSRRLRAFMGVQVDAELPGDIPAAEPAYA